MYASNQASCAAQFQHAGLVAKTEAPAESVFMARASDRPALVSR